MALFIFQKELASAIKLAKITAFVSFYNPLVTLTIHCHFVQKYKKGVLANFKLNR
jgi:hypothetical protein